MNHLHTVCAQMVTELNDTEGWQLPTEALSDLAREILPFFDSSLSGQKSREVIRNYYHDSPLVTHMLPWNDPEGEALWEVVRRKFISLAYREGIPDTDAEDVAQVAWRKAREKLATFRFRSRLQAWLNAIIRNECRQWFRPRKDRLADLPLDTLDLGDEGQEAQQAVANEYQRVRAVGDFERQLGAAESHALYAERIAALKQAVEQLVSEKRMVILYYSFVETDYVAPDGQIMKWTDEKIAQEVGLASGSIAQTRERVLERLRSDPHFRQLVVEYFGADWLSNRTLGRKGRVRKQPVRASHK